MRGPSFEVRSHGEVAASTSSLSISDDDSQSASSSQLHPPSTPTIACVVLGGICITPWYSSTYPLDRSAVNYLFVCPYCLKYSLENDQMHAHMTRFCTYARKPVGEVIKHFSKYTVREVDGAVYQNLCQCLSLFARFFLRTKSVHFTVDAFKFYIMTEEVAGERPTDLPTYRMVGFFSKEKVSWELYNLACILIFPPYARKGLGRTLIEISYELARKDHMIGSPEKPLSEPGRKAYLSYWSSIVAPVILDYSSGSERSPDELSSIFSHNDSAQYDGTFDLTPLSVDVISRTTYIHPDDVLDTLIHMGSIFKQPNSNEVFVSKAHIRKFLRNQATVNAASNL